MYSIIFIKHYKLTHIFLSSLSHLQQSNFLNDEIGWRLSTQVYQISESQLCFFSFNPLGSKRLLIRMMLLEDMIVFSVDEIQSSALSSRDSSLGLYLGT